MLCDVEGIPCLSPDDAPALAHSLLPDPLADAYLLLSAYTLR